MAVIIELVKTGSKYALWKMMQLGLMEIKLTKKPKLKLLKSKKILYNKKRGQIWANQLQEESAGCLLGAKKLLLPEVGK